jgi:dissimilatory sulfite reductase (desulfoviridin) alpha/beta subunit
LSPTRFYSPNICSGQVIAPGDGGVPVFDREKCVHSGACIWNCAQPLPDDPERTNIAFRAGTDGLPPAGNLSSVRSEIFVENRYTKTSSPVRGGICRSCLPRQS